MATTDLPSKLGSELERIVLERIASNRLVLPAMPSVPQRCLDILREPDFNVRRLVKELEAEPVLALLVIRAANAASYGRSATLQALDQAVVRLGSRALRTLITEYAVNELFESSNRRLKEANRRGQTPATSRGSCTTSASRCSVRCCSRSTASSAARRRTGSICGRGPRSSRTRTARSGSRSPPSGSSRTRSPPRSATAAITTARIAPRWATWCGCPMRSPSARATRPDRSTPPTSRR
ncbi:MAG: HDOD domain-containing protein [Deltaproteobacteria bacterium]|nr:MAG: HDOD domain-containing protein [Deltaproteobacteria bacterium]